MIRMIKVIEPNGHETGYLAEVPGLPGRYVRAESLPELKKAIRAAIADPQGTKFASSSWSACQTGYSTTAIFLTL
jgi:hypothetical protein